MAPKQRRGRSKAASSMPTGPTNTSIKSSKNRRQIFTWLLALLAIAGGAAYYNYIFPYRAHPERGQVFNTEIAFVVVDLPGKGKGVIAARDIQQGELLIREKPLIVVPSQISTSPAELISNKLALLTPSQRASFYNLSYVNLPDDAPPEQKALAIFETNAVAAGEKGVGLFPTMARLNHGCSSAFNVVYSWREDEGLLVVYALKKILKNEEVLTAYTNTKRVRGDRRNYLSQQYGFHCMCAACYLPDAESEASDGRLSEMSRLLEHLATWGQKRINGIEAIGIVRRIWGIGEEEAYWSERGALAGDAAWVAAAHQDAQGTKEWAQLAAKWYTYELGGDSNQVRDMEATMQWPERHRVWGARERLEVGGPGRLLFS